MTSPSSAPRDSVQIHWLTAYPASCLVRGDDGRPKTLVYGDVERGRLSSAAVKRAVRTSETFTERFEGRLGTRTRRISDVVTSRLIASGAEPDKAQAAADATLACHLETLGSPDERRPGWIKQLAFVSEEEIASLVSLAQNQLLNTCPGPVPRTAKKAGRPKAVGDNVPKPAIESVLRSVTGSVDIGLFGRFFAKDRMNTIVGACEVAHPFTVGRAVQETDFYVAVDDHSDREDDAAGGFLGENFFSSGLYYGYARIDMRQLRENLGGDIALASDAASAMVEGLLTVSPRGKITSYGSHAMASWAMVERGSSMPSSLAATFLRPVMGDDPLREAVDRAESLSRSLEKAYATRWQRSILDLTTQRGSLAELLAVLD